MRLDQYLYAQGLTQSRERARALIMAGQVYMNGEKALKAGSSVPDKAIIELREKDIPYVSRGGLKLEKAFQSFNTTVTQKICMDIGASTGGFTDCMLQNGAKHVYSVDVGYGQLDWKLRNDSRVTVMERTNIRKVSPEMIPDPIEFFSADVSFISLKHIFPVVKELLVPGSHGVCLIKPQFEAGKDKVGKNGVIRDTNVRAETIQLVQEYANNNGFSSLNFDYSPIKGPKGNVEFIYHIVYDSQKKKIDEKQIWEVANIAHTNLD